MRRPFTPILAVPKTAREPRAEHLRSRSARRGAALFEVVISLSILLMAMTLVGASFRNGFLNVEMADRISRATLLTEKLITDIEVGLISIAEQESFGQFSDEAEPGMGWRVEVHPDPVTPDLLRVQVDILRVDPENPKAEASCILTTHLLRVMPRGLDFQKDLGMTEEQVAMLMAVVPGGESLVDPENFSPPELAKLPMDVLKQLLPMIIQAFGGNLAAGQLDRMMEAAQKGDISGLQELAQQALQQQPSADGSQAQPGQEPDTGQKGGR
jgi:hypothetical protein